MKRTHHPTGLTEQNDRHKIPILNTLAVARCALGGKTRTEHGNIRLTSDDRYHGRAENIIVELSDGRIAMINRGDRLRGDTVAILHNPNPKHRSPMALWISFDSMKTWPYRRVLVPESCDGPKGRMNYPDGFVSKDKQWLHFAFDDNRHRAVYYGTKLPPLKTP